MPRVTVTCDCDFEVDGVAFRVYRDWLWADGGEKDDYSIRELPQVAALENSDDTTEIVITASDIKEAQDYINDYAYDNDDEDYED